MEMAILTGANTAKKVLFNSSQYEVGGNRSRSSVISVREGEKGKGPPSLPSMFVLIPPILGFSCRFDDHRDDEGSNRSCPDSNRIMTPTGGTLEDSGFPTVQVSLRPEREPLE